MGRVSEKITTFLPWPEIEPEAQKQILNTAELPFLFKWVAVMPDCHYGKGATVGTVIATKGAVVPAAVGVDIGCGMIALETRLGRGDLNELHRLREGIERRIPMSAGHNNRKITDTAEPRIAELKKLESATGANYNSFDKEWPVALGTLGGGNHFAEVCIDENDKVWLTLHSGSRGVGNRIGNHSIRKAQEWCKKRNIALPDRDLAYLAEGTEEFDNYLRDLHWAQHFALLNREEMMDRMLRELSHHIYGEAGHERELEIQRINCHHNFTQVEHHFGHNVWVTRKGAIEAREGMRGMIPGSMGTRSYIVTGLGNPQSFQSAPHGAGRRMSRTKARASYAMKDLEAAMAGIEFRRSKVLLDEIPGAYKDIDHVMENARDLVRIDHTLRQIHQLQRRLTPKSTSAVVRAFYRRGATANPNLQPLATPASLPSAGPTPTACSPKPRNPRCDEPVHPSCTSKELPMPEMETQIPPAQSSLTQSQNKAAPGEPHRRGERRRDRRHKGPRQVWIQVVDESGKLFEEIQIMRDYSRGGFYFVSSLPCYRAGARLHVIPSFGSLNLEFVAEVVRVEPRPRMAYGVAVKLLHARDSIAPHSSA